MPLSMSSTVAEPEVLESQDADGGAYLAPDEAVLRIRHDILSGRHWFDALLDAIGNWRAPFESAAGREYHYLVGGEAFDWLLLAERLLEELRDIVPPAEADALLWEGRWPIDLDDSEFAERLGPAKFSAHLNYLYGVLVEEALQLHVEEELWKEAYARVWGHDPRSDEGMYRRVYGKGLLELKALYYQLTGRLLRDEIDYPEWKDFTYWLFRYRLKWQDKARVASDTRKGLAQLTRMELAVSERRRGARLAEDDFLQRYTG
jgi:hypothetical protein